MSQRRGKKMRRAPEVPMVGAKTATRKASVLENLKDEEARSVLGLLLAAHPELRKEAETIARSYLGELTFEEVADAVEEAVSALDIQDLNGRAGKHAWGYVEPTEAAWEILGEAVEPFVADIRRRIELGLEADALEICKGVVLGLHRVEHDNKGELVEWAPDFPAEAAGDAIEAWRGEVGQKQAAAKRPGRKSPELPTEFVDQWVPDWRDMIARIVSRKR